MSTATHPITHPLVGCTITDLALIGTTRKGRITAVAEDDRGFAVTVLWSNGSYNEVRPTAGRYSVEVGK